MTDSKANGNGTANGDAQDANFNLEKVYIKDSSFESPRAPAVFQEEWSPDISIDLQTQTQPISGDLYEVVLTVSVDAKSDDETIFLAELHQAGIVTIAGFDDEQRAQLLGSYVPGILFPYARAAVSEAVTRGGFPQLLLQPVNFDALYQQQRHQVAQADSHGTVGTA